MCVCVSEERAGTVCAHSHTSIKILESPLLAFQHNECSTSLKTWYQGLQGMMRPNFLPFDQSFDFGFLF